MSLHATETELYRDLWTGVESYGRHAPGERYAAAFAEMVAAHAPRCVGGTVLDAGCGSGKGALALAGLGYQPSLYDLTPEGLIEEARRIQFVAGTLWSDLPASYAQPFDLVYCTDVLEHIDPALTMLVVHQLLSVCVGGVFVAVHLLPDAFGAWVGRPLHQTVQHFTWWRDRIAEVGDLLESRDLLADAVFFVRPR